MRRHRSLSLAVTLFVLAAGCTSQGDAGQTTTTSADPTTTLATETPTTTIVATTTTSSGHNHEGEPSTADLSAASLASAGFQDVAMAETAGYVSTMEGLGCFQSAESGGMGLHYLNEALMDATLEVTAPEALVYELDATGQIASLVAHEYIVPVDAWTEEAPPRVFGQELHQHPTLPLWVLHAWLWKDNPAGFFNDWNPAVRMCPEGVPVFGVDLP